MPKLYPQSMTAGGRAEVSDLGYRGQELRLKNRGQVYLLLTLFIPGSKVSVNPVAPCS